MDALWIDKIRSAAADVDETKFIELLKEIATGTNEDGLPTFDGKMEELSEFCAILSVIEASDGICASTRFTLIDLIYPQIDLMKFLALVAEADKEIERDYYDDVPSDLLESFKCGYSEDTEEEVQALRSYKATEFIAWVYYELDTIDSRYAASIIKLAFDETSISYETMFAYLALSIVKDEG